MGILRLCEPKLYESNPDSRTPWSSCSNLGYRCDSPDCCCTSEGRLDVVVEAVEVRNEEEDKEGTESLLLEEKDEVVVLEGCGVAVDEQATDPSCV